MRRTFALLLFLLALGACSPEASRDRGSPASGDGGNHGDPLVLREGAQPFRGVPDRRPPGGD